MWLTWFCFAAFSYGNERNTFLLANEDSIRTKQNKTRMPRETGQLESTSAMVINNLGVVLVDTDSPVMIESLETKLKLNFNYPSPAKLYEHCSGEQLKVPVDIGIQEQFENMKTLFMKTLLREDLVPKEIDVTPSSKPEMTPGTTKGPQGIPTRPQLDKPLADHILGIATNFGSSIFKDLGLTRAISTVTKI